MLYVFKIAVKLKPLLTPSDEYFIDTWNIR